MSRVIKFRAWSTIDTPKMVDINPKTSGLFAKVDLEDADNWRVMQYTGLKDRNGDPIYEGDILSGEDYEPFEVKWCNNLGSFEPYYKGACSACNQEMYWHEIVNYLSHLEVIGNIYENPELLEAAS